MSRRKTLSSAEAWQTLDRYKRQPDKYGEIKKVKYVRGRARRTLRPVTQIKITTTKGRWLRISEPRRKLGITTSRNVIRALGFDDSRKLDAILFGMPVVVFKKKKRKGAQGE